VLSHLSAGRKYSTASGTRVTMKFECNSCGQIADVPQTGPADSASCTEPSQPPAGWREIFTTINEHDEDGNIQTSAGEVLHSCADCNAQMSVDEHHEAEFEGRKRGMAGSKKANK
jgi:hypothetical protein